MARPLTKQLTPNTESAVAQSVSVPAEVGSLNDGAELAAGNYAPQGPPRVPPDVPSGAVSRPLWRGPLQGRCFAPFDSGAVSVECC